jgi:hypothetical protein
MVASTNLTKIDSNVTGLRYAEEDSLCVLPATPVWEPLEPNSYDSFGGEISLVARNPINSGRQRQKGVVVDLDASGGTQQDMTQDNLQDLMQGFMFADFRRKNDVGLRRSNRRPGIGGEFDDYTITDINTTGDTITVDSRVANTAAVVAGGTGYAVDDIVELTDASATVLQRWRVATESAGVVLTVDQAVPAVVVSNAVPIEGRTPTDTGVGAATTAITGTGDNALTLTVTNQNGLVWQTGDMLFLAGNNDTANDGVKTVASVADNVITVNENLTTDATPAVTATMTTVGFEGAAGDIDVTGGAIPILTSTTLDFTTLGLVPGEIIFIGGDLAANKFTTVVDTNEVNNGWARIKSIAANALTLDKTQFLMVTEASTTETIRLHFGRVLKNEATPALQVRRSYNLERELGAPDPTLPAEIQGEYLVGAVPSELTLTMNTADKILADLNFVAVDNTQVTGATGLKSGTRPALVSGDAYNTSNDFSRLKMSILDPLDSNPSALFAFVTDFTVSINNNLSPNKAISVLGAFEVTAGQFNVEGSLTAYFADVAAVASVRANDDVTLDFAIVKGSSGNKRGVAVDIPLIALGDGRLNVEQDSPITLPLDMPAAADRVFNHTLLTSFFDFLPDVSDTA